MSLLMKWMWQWIQPDQAWWKEATPKIGAHVQPWESQSASHFWQDINSLAPLFNSSTTFTLGTGETIQLWYDNWNQEELNHQFSRLFEQVRYKDASVAQCYANEAWNITVAGALTFEGQQDMVNLQLHVQNIKPLQNIYSAKWLRHSSTLFSTKSAYKFISHTPHVRVNIHLIWKLQLPTKIHIFIWLMIRRKLLTADNLI
jgi:zinc-binding in reverse transcriptase